MWLGQRQCWQKILGFNTQSSFIMRVWGYLYALVHCIWSLARTPSILVKAVCQSCFDDVSCRPPANHVLKVLLFSTTWLLCLIPASSDMALWSHNIYHFDVTLSIKLKQICHHVSLWDWLYLQYFFSSYILLSWSGSIEYLFTAAFSKIQTFSNYHTSASIYKYTDFRLICNEPPLIKEVQHIQIYTASLIYTLWKL